MWIEWGAREARLDVVKEGQGRAVALAALGPLRGAGGLSEGASVYIRGRYQMSYIYTIVERGAESARFHRAFNRISCQIIKRQE